MLLVGLTGARVRWYVQPAARRCGMAGQHGGVTSGSLFGEQWHKNRFRTPYLRNTLWDWATPSIRWRPPSTWSQVRAGACEAIETAIRTSHGRLRRAGACLHPPVAPVPVRLAASTPPICSAWPPSPDETWQRWQRSRPPPARPSSPTAARSATSTASGTDHAALPARRERACWAWLRMRRPVPPLRPGGHDEPGQADARWDQSRGERHSGIWHRQLARTKLWQSALEHSPGT